MDIQKKKQLLNSLLESKGRGSHTRLAQFCGVRPQMVSNWLNQAAAGWTSIEKEKRIAAFFGIDPACFSGEKELDLSALPTSNIVVADVERLPALSHGSTEKKGASLKSAVDNLPTYADMLDWIKAACEQALPTMNEALRPKTEAVFTSLATLLESRLTTRAETRPASGHTEEIIWLDGALLEFERGIKALRNIQSERGLHVLAYIHEGLEKHLRCLTHVGVWPPDT